MAEPCGGNALNIWRPPAAAAVSSPKIQGSAGKPPSTSHLTPASLFLFFFSFFFLISPPLSSFSKTFCNPNNILEPGFEAAGRESVTRRQREGGESPRAPLETLSRARALLSPRLPAPVCQHGLTPPGLWAHPVSMGGAAKLPLHHDVKAHPGLSWLQTG